MSNRQLAIMLGYNVDFFASMKMKTPEKFAYIFPTGEVSLEEWNSYLNDVAELISFWKTFMSTKAKLRIFQEYRAEVLKHYSALCTFERTMRDGKPETVRLSTVKLAKQIKENLGL